MTIIKYETNQNIDVEFESGYVATNKTYANFKLGNIFDPTYYKTLRIGEVSTQMNGDDAEIIDYKDVTNITVKFKKTGTIISDCRYCNFKNGNIKDYNARTVFGVGSSNGLSTTTKEAKVWYEMMGRCYYNDSRNSDYYGKVIVCEEWLDLKNFKKWYDEHYYEVEGECMHLDKDLLCNTKGINNKIYSPNTCVFLPSIINNILTERNTIHDRNLPRGVHESNGKYYSVFRKEWSCAKETIEEALEDYKNKKRQYILFLAEQYKDKIPYYIYCELLKYKI